MTIPIGPIAGALTLNPELYSEDQEYAYPMAKLLAPEIEKERTRLMRSMRPFIRDHPLVGKGLCKPVSELPWYELLARLEILKRVCNKRGIALEVTCMTIWRFLTPPNWQVFFWMDRCLQSNGHSAIKDWKFKEHLQITVREARLETARIASQRGKAAADALHGKPGGNRDKAEAVRAAWASGKYSSRDICAEQECAALGSSFSTARRALRGTPEPA